MEKIKKVNDGNLQNRIVYFDILNIMAIIAVVFMHCNGIVHGSPNVRAWDTSLLVDCIMYWAVPVFFMLSGARLMNYRKKYDTKTFFKKRLIKILIPFFFWTVVMFVWKIHIKQFAFEHFNIVTLANAFFQNQEEATYYFMFDILALYLTMPLLSLLTKDEYRKTLWLIIGLYFIFNSFLPNILLLLGINYNQSLGIQIGGYAIYAILGYLLSTEETTKKQRIIVYILALVGLVYRYLTTFIMSKAQGEVIRLTWGYTTWHAILLAIAVFLFIKNLHLENKIQSTKVRKVMTEISTCSFGIYLSHLIVKHYTVALFDFDIYSWQFRTLGAVLVYLITLSGVWIMKKIPIIKKVVP